MVDFDVVCNDREHYGNGPHAHVDDMLFVPLDGFFSVEGNESPHPRIISTGTVWFVPGRGVHQVKASPAQRHLCYYVDMPSLLSKSHNLGHDEQPHTCYWNMSTLLMDLVRLRKHFSTPRSAPAGMSGQDIDRMILRELGRIVRTAAVSSGGAQADIAIAQIKTFIADHLEADLRCGTLAAYFDISERTLARWFHDREGESVGQYVLHTRLDEALRLLRASTLSIADIQTAVGFSSPAHFGYAMKKAFGHAPTQLRRGAGLLARNR